jgi:hypothetical protein
MGFAGDGRSPQFGGLRGAGGPGYNGVGPVPPVGDLDRVLCCRQDRHALAGPEALLQGGQL